MKPYYEIIGDFRDQINEDVDFIILKYSNKENKNLWNCICSSMDWITVACDYLNSLRIDHNNLNHMSMQLYSYLSAIDIIWEAILQLHRVIINKKTIPFTGRTDIFNDKRLSKDDNEFFKQIRAAFGAHPVNMNDDIKRFASWTTTGIYDEYDYAVILYSSETDEEDIIFGFQFEQIETFLKQRIAYLEVILLELKKQKKMHNMHYRKVPIQQHDDIIKQLEILKNENSIRFNNDYYENIINSLLLIFKTNITDKSNYRLVNQYKKALLIKIGEITRVFKNMQETELKIFNLIHPQLPKDNIFHYEYSKICENIYSNHRKRIISISSIIKYLEHDICFNYSSEDELLVLVKAGLYNSNKKRYAEFNL